MSVTQIGTALGEHRPPLGSIVDSSMTSICLDTYNAMKALYFYIDYVLSLLNCTAIYRNFKIYATVEHRQNGFFPGPFFTFLPNFIEIGPVDFVQSCLDLNKLH